MRARSAPPQTVLTVALAAVFATAGLVYAMHRQVPGRGPAAMHLFAQAPVSLVEEPRHRVVFESGTTRVHDVQVPPGDTTLYHVHDTPILYVPIGRSLMRSQVLGAEWTGGDPSRVPAPPAGPQRVYSVISYVDTPVTHRVNNVGDGLFRLIAIVNRAPGGDEQPAAIEGLPAAPELVNRYYRAFRLVLPPGESTTAHTHGTAVVAVQQTEGRLTVEGSAHAELQAPGAFAYHDGSGTHRVRNTGATSVEVIEVELRGSR